MRTPAKKGGKYTSVAPEQEQESTQLMHHGGEIELSGHDGELILLEEEKLDNEALELELEEATQMPKTLDEALRELGQARAQISALQKQLKARGHDGVSDDEDMEREPVAGTLEEYLRTPMHRLLMQRLPWLLVLLVLQSCSALILHSADEMIEKHLVIAYFVPMVVGTGGNAGNQPGVMVTRALSTRRSNSPFPIWRLLLKEVGLGLVAGLCVAGTAFFRVLMEFPNDSVGAIAIALAMFLVVIIAIGLGILFSWGLERCNCDPAAGSAPLLTTVSDLMGIGILTGLAYAILG